VLQLSQAEAEVGLVDALHDLEAEHLGIETLAPIAVGDRKVDVRNASELRHEGIQPRTRFS
jgi:hypothetical protein